MADARGAVPGGVEVILHVRVIGEQFAVAIQRRIEHIAEARGEDFKLSPIGRHAIDDAARAHRVAHETPAIRHARQQMVFAPEVRHGRSRSERRGFGAVAAHQVQAFAIRGEQHRMHAMITACIHLAQQFHFIQIAIAFAVRDAVQAAGDLALVIVHAHIQRAKGPQHAVDPADRRRKLFHILGIERLACRRWREAIQPAVLITGEDAPLVIHTQVHPGTLLHAGNRVEQFHFETLRHFQTVHRRRLVLANGRPHLGGGLGLGRTRFGFGLSG